MIIKFIAGLILLLPFIGFSQGEFNNWYFGWYPPMGTGVTFNSGFPVTIPNGVLLTAATDVSISDSVGSLLFFSDGGDVYNKNKVIMPNGFGLHAHKVGFVQPVVATPKLDDDSSYYLFTVGQFSPVGTTYGLLYSIINMRLDGGLGDVDPAFKNIQVMAASWQAVTGTRHKNNKYTWIITTFSSPSYIRYAAFLIDNSGLSTTPVFSQSFGGGQVSPPYYYYIAPQSIRVSPDGTKLVGCYETKPEFCIFNSQTGAVNRLFYIPSSTGTVAAEFSIDSKYLYVSTITHSDSGAIYQYDATLLDSTAFMRSKIMIDSGHLRSGIQMGPDWKIYGTVLFKDSLNVINNPSVYGSGCNFQRNAVVLGGPCSDALPQFIQRYKAYIHFTGNCEDNPIQFSGDIWPPPDSIHWNFGDPGSGLNNYSNLNNATHTYANAGTYTVELFVRHNDNRTDTSWQTINIFPSPQPALGPDRTICGGNSTTFDAGACTGCSFLWKDQNTGFPVGTTQTFTTNQAGTYILIVTNPNGCAGTDTVQLITTIIPAVNNDTLEKTICSGAPTNIPLTGNVPGVMFHWTATLTAGNISGFSADSGLAINQTLINNGATAAVVAYHITPKIGDCSGANVDFPVTVNIGDPVDVSITASGNTVCAGTTVTFTATAVNPGASPVYQWKVNGANSGSNAPTFAYFPANGDIVKCVLTSSNTICTSNNPATSNSITMVVNPLLPVSVSISSSSNPVCAGTPVNFNAIPINGGAMHIYQWKVNGTNEGTNNPVFTFSPVNGDVVTCSLSSSETCTSGNPALSNPITMLVNANLPAGITIAASANPFCPGATVTFTSTAINGGAMPTYQWKVNSIISIPSILSILTYNPANSDTVSCILTSNLSCITGNPATSPKIVMSGTLAPIVSFASCFDTVTTVNAKPFKLKGGLPLGGTYSGPGVNSITGTFTPSIAGTGLKTIIYTYTNVAACSAAKSKTILVLANPAFICGNTLADIRDGKSYPTVLIGTQCWMSSNLDFGFPISDSTPQTDNCTPEKYLRPSSLVPRPSFYQWDELMRYQTAEGSQGLCPPGWHVPTESEWATLFDYYQGASKAGSPLQDLIINGFKALRSGVFYLNSSWSFPDFATIFWSSTSSGQTKAISHGMNLYNFSVSLYPASRGNAFAARCLKD